MCPAVISWILADRLGVAPMGLAQPVDPGGGGLVRERAPKADLPGLQVPVLVGAAGIDDLVGLVVEVSPTKINV